MLKVVCVKELLPRKGMPAGMKLPQVGSEYTVIGEGISKELPGVEVYEFAEYPPAGWLTFRFIKKCFAPLSDIDEVEIMNQRYDAEVERIDRELREIIQEVENQIV